MTITSDMEVLENSLFLDQVPPIWTSRAYPSLLGLTSWFVDLLMRLRELETWSTDFVVIFFFLRSSLLCWRVINLKNVSATLRCLVSRVFQSTISFNCHHAEYSQKKRIAIG